MAGITTKTIAGTAILARRRSLVAPAARTTFLAALRPSSDVAVSCPNPAAPVAGVDFGQGRHM